MNRIKVGGSSKIFENAHDVPKSGTYLLCLYIAGFTLRSFQAIENVQTLCNEHLKGRYRLEVVDAYRQPERTQKEQIIAAPTLVKKLPPPLRRFIGDMSDPERILAGLELVFYEADPSDQISG